MRGKQRWKRKHFKREGAERHYSLWEPPPPQQNTRIKSTKSKTGGEFSLNTLVPQTGELSSWFAILWALDQLSSQVRRKLLLLPTHPVTLCKEEKIGPGGEESVLDMRNGVAKIWLPLVPLVYSWSHNYIERVHLIMSSMTLNILVNIL